MTNLINKQNEFNKVIKECPEDKILNPESNHCVNKNGIIGKKIIKKLNANISTKPALKTENFIKGIKQYDKEDCLKWFKNMLVDPTTDRKITQNTKGPKTIFHQLNKQCNKYKDSKVKAKSISPILSVSKSISKKPLVKVKNENNINYIKEFAVHTEKSYEIVEDLNQSMIDACPTNVFNKAYFQYFVGQYISKRTPFNNLLLFYTVGTGKTCAAISIAESILIGHNNFDEPPIIVIVPKTLMQNFKNTIYDLHKHNINQCSEDIYKLNNFDSPLHLNQFIQKRYNIMTYSEFIKYSTNNTIQNKTIIIDEAHNLRNPGEVDDDGEDKTELKKIYTKVETAIQNGKNNRLILMSGTPMFNESSEIKDLLNLLLLNDGKSKITHLTNELLANLSSQYISYINSQNPFVYPIRIQHEDATMRDSTPDGLIKVKLNNKQISKNTDHIMNNFKNMNIAYSPAKCFLKSEFKYTHIGKIKVLDSTNITTYAPKIAKVIDYIKNTNGIAVIYSNYIEYGILQIALALEYIGYSRYVDNSSKIFNLLDDSSIKRNSKLKYAIITSENNQHINNVGSPKNIDNILKLVNSDSNIYGDKLKVILITKKASEGLSLLNVREIHILDPWWHFNRHEQIIGRGFRRCSHIKLPLELRNITVFVYCGYFEDKVNIKSEDEHAYDIASKKLSTTKSYISIIEENAFDNRINEKLNVFPKALFENVNPVKIITSQNNHREYVLGQDKEYRKPIDKALITDNNLRSEKMFLSNRYVTIIKDTIKQRDYISYEELLSKCNDKRYLDLAINNVIFPNKIGNYLLIFNNNGIQKITDVPDIVEKEIILEEPVLNKPKTPINNDTIIDKYEKKYKDFELLYRFLMHYINNTNWDNIAINIITNKNNYPKLYKLLSDNCIIINDTYFDIFSTDKPLPIKDLNGNNININTLNYEEQTIKNKTMYGNIGVATKSKGVLTKNLVFKIVSGSNKGTKCETQPGPNLDKILNEKSNNKTDKCIKIAKKFYNENNLIIVPYIKMKK